MFGEGKLIFPVHTVVELKIIWADKDNLICANF